MRYSELKSREWSVILSRKIIDNCVKGCFCFLLGERGITVTCSVQVADREGPEWTHHSLEAEKDMETKGETPGLSADGMPGKAILKVTLAEVLRSAKGNFIFFPQEWKLSCQNIVTDTCRDKRQK